MGKSFMTMKMGIYLNGYLYISYLCGYFDGYSDGYIGLSSTINGVMTDF